MSNAAIDSELAARFLEFSRKRLMEQNWPNLRACVESLTEEQIWWRANEASNSIGNLLLHLNGNVGHWPVASFNGLESNRNRPLEFNAQEQPSAAELLRRLGATLDQAAQVLARLTAAELLAPYTVQGIHTRGLDAVYRAVEHFGLHYGQIAYITKELQAKDLGFSSVVNQTGIGR